MSDLDAFNARRAVIREFRQQFDEWSARERRARARLVLRCPSGHLVATVYDEPRVGGILRGSEARADWGAAPQSIRRKDVHDSDVRMVVAVWVALDDVPDVLRLACPTHNCPSDDLPISCVELRRADGRRASIKLAGVAER